MNSVHQRAHRTLRQPLSQSHGEVEDQLGSFTTPPFVEPPPHPGDVSGEGQQRRRRGCEPEWRQGQREQHESQDQPQQVAAELDHELERGLVVVGDLAPGRREG